MRRFKGEAPPGDGRGEEILDGLNAAQRRAVMATDGPELIIAGPGSGKTRVLTMRIAYLLATGRAQPHRILALTFTNKAAREIRERVGKLVGEGLARDMWLGTFHSIFRRLLVFECRHLGFKSNFSIYDTDDTERELKRLMKDFGMDASEFKPRAMRSIISTAKNRMETPSIFEETAVSAAHKAAARLYGPYQERLRRSNAMDFDDLLLKPLELFRKKPDILARYQKRWTHHHIDEYQDTNRVQYLLAKQLAAVHRNLFVVGDDAQSIYRFRGADITNILSFKSDYPEANVVRLEQNYRSTKAILQIADTTIKNNKEQLEKDLWTENADGDPVVLLECLSDRDEAQNVAGTIRRLCVTAGYGLNDFAVLYRTNAQSRSLEDALREDGIAYRVFGGMSFYQRKEVKDALAYLRLLVNPNDFVSLRRVINFPTRGIGAKSQQILFAPVVREDLSAWETVERAEGLGLSAAARGKVAGFRKMILDAAAALEGGDVVETARDLLVKAKLLDEYLKGNTPEGLARWQNVQALLSAVAEYVHEAEGESTLEGFLQDIALFTDADEKAKEKKFVSLMTLHASKGLEFPVVFIAGMEEGLFPSQRDKDDAKRIEEERRLFYVGVTRGEKRLYLCCAAHRYLYGGRHDHEPSRFVREIEPLLLRKAGGWKGGGRSRFSPPKGGENRGRRSRPRSMSEQPSGSSDAAFDGIRPGVRVLHGRFGVGRVIRVNRNGAYSKAVVQFDGFGHKNLMLQYARLKLLDSDEV